MKKNLPYNIPAAKSVNLPPEEVSRAESLALDDETIWRLVDLIFSQRDESTLPS